MQLGNLGNGDELGSKGVWRPVALDSGANKINFSDVGNESLLNIRWAGVCNYA